MVIKWSEWAGYIQTPLTPNYSKTISWNIKQSKIMQLWIINTVWQAHIIQTVIKITERCRNHEKENEKLYKKDLRSLLMNQLSLVFCDLFETFSNQLSVVRVISEERRLLRFQSQPKPHKWRHWDEYTTDIVTMMTSSNVTHANGVNHVTVASLPHDEAEGMLNFLLRGK